jgi:type I restriction enzyme, S subunit
MKIKPSNNWNHVKLGEITLKIGSGATPRGGKESYKDTGITLIRSLNVYDFKFDYDGLAFIDERQAQQLANVEVKLNDILLNITGASVARCCIVPSQLLPARVNQHVAIVRVNPNLANHFYVLYCINSHHYKNYLLTLAQGGATREALTKDTISNFEIPLPSLSTQTKIASILSAYDDLIENNTRRIKILEEMAQTLYHEWFVKFRFPGHEKVKMVESELGLIPEECEVKQLGDIAQEIRRNVQPDTINPETPYFGLEHLPRKSIALCEWGTAAQVQSTKLLFKKGEILFGKIRPYFHKVGVAPIDGICSSDIIVIQPKDIRYFAIILSCVSSEDFVNHATQTSQGTKMPRANWDVLVKYPILIPKEPLLQQFNEFVYCIVNQINNLVFKNRNLREMRDLLLPKLISGDIDVEKLNIDTLDIAA